MQPKSRRAAWWQAIVLLGSAAAITAVLVVRLHRPFDADTLSIKVGDLRSNAAEAELLMEQASKDHLAPGFIRRHAQQIRTNVERVRDDIDGKPGDALREPQRHEALGLATLLTSKLDALARDAAAPDADAQAFATVANSLDALDHRIKPGG
ncbi:hypothetical protein [Lysobacter sp. HA18]